MENTGRTSRPVSAKTSIQTIQLEYPIDVFGDGEVVTEISFSRRATLGDLAAAERNSKTDFDRVVFLLMRLCDLTRREVEALDASDMGPIAEYLETLVSGRPTIGEVV
jgi:uncharacterized protein YkuJ